jgi:uncharacterized membrane protein
MLPYNADIDSNRKWQTSIAYTFSSQYNSSVFSEVLSIDNNTITGNGDSTKWQMAIDAVKAVSLVPLVQASTPASANLGLLSGTINGIFTGVGYRNSTSSDITRGLGMIEGDQGKYLYLS